MPKENTEKSNDLPLKGLVVLITGAASGIGAATVLEVVFLYWWIVMNSRWPKWHSNAAKTPCIWWPM
jgi:NAD(P)-dependent dehydrogenase (short-subunit alcohol dehydrogenase family)